MLRPGKGYDNGLPSHGGGGGGGTGYGGYNSNSGGGSSSAYGGYSGAQANAGYPSTSSATATHLYHSKRNKQELPLVKFLLILVCLVLFGTTLHYRGKYNGTLSKLNVKSIDEAVRIVTNAEREKARWKRDSQQTRMDQDGYKKKLEKLEDENKRLQKEKDELRIQYDTQKTQQQQPPPNKQTLETREKAMMKQIQLLQNATQRECKRAAIEKFGPGPHFVKLSLQLPGDDAQGIEHYAVVEMAPLDLMPHAVHLFLEQVAHKLWDNTVLYLNGPHIMQAGPQDYVGDSEISALEPFVNNQLDKLAFPEYSPEYPHLPFVSV
jgi:hypothetical protein